MKSSKRVITLLVYRNLYAKDFAIRQLIDEVLRDVPSADLIEITAVDLFDSPEDPGIPEQPALFDLEEDHIFPSSAVPPSVREPVLPDEQEAETHSLEEAV